MIVLHYLEKSRSTRIIWLLEELGVPYETIVWPRTKDFMAPPEMKKLSPSASAPFIVDDGIAIAESGCIIQYLIEKYGKDSELVPRSEAEKLAVDYRLFAGEGNIMAYTMYCFINSMATPKIPFGLRTLAKAIFSKIESSFPRPRVEAAFKDLDASIRDNGGYVVGGHLTGADIMYQFTVYFADKTVFPNVLKTYPHIAQWLEKLKTRPAFERAIAKEKELNQQVAAKSGKL